MGYGYYEVKWGGPDGHGERGGGYMVLATCDQRGCDAEIDRGLGYICGDDPHGPGRRPTGCGRYYCVEHSSWVGPRGGCRHRGKRAWGKTLSDLVPNEDGSIVCCDRIGHDGPHAWAREADE